MDLLIGLLEVYERIAHPLNVALKQDGITFMILGRSISAALGTATIPLVYLIAERVSGRVAGLVAAALTAAGVLHLRDSHFFSVDVSLTFFSILAWLFLMHVAGSGAIRSYLAAGVAIGAAIACKDSAAFLLPLTLVAHLAAPGRPPRAPQWGAWTAWLLKGAIPGVVAGVTFLLLDPFVWLEFNKAVAGIGELVTGPMTGEIRAIWGAQFTTVQPRPFWFTNLLWWGLGPAFEIWAILGVGWLLWRRDRFALMAAAFPIVYYIVAGRSNDPSLREICSAAGSRWRGCRGLQRGSAPAPGRAARGRDRNGLRAWDNRALRRCLHERVHQTRQPAGRISIPAQSRSRRFPHPD